jgi:hypothetical protein
MATSEPSSSICAKPSKLSVCDYSTAPEKKKTCIVTGLLANLYPQQKLLSTDLSAAILTADVFYQFCMNAWVMLQNYGHLFAGGELIWLSGQLQFITVYNAKFSQLSHLLH